MRKNIIVIGYDYALSRRISALLADMFDMRSFDMYDMFNFDNYPNTLSDVLQKNGEEYVDNCMRGIIKSEMDFSGVVFVADTKVMSLCVDLFDQIAQNNIILFMKRDFKIEFNQRENFVFKTNEEKQYFSMTIDKLVETEQTIANELADFVLDIDNLTYREIKDDILEKIKNLLN